MSKRFLLFMTLCLAALFTVTALMPSEAGSYIRKNGSIIAQIDGSYIRINGSIAGEYDGSYVRKNGSIYLQVDDYDGTERMKRFIAAYLFFFDR